jgi:hypothetical protein
VLRSFQFSMTRTAYWILRLGAAACFIGHGAFGIITKEAWVPYFGLVGIPRDLAFQLMPLVGTVDIVAGFSVLFAPRPIVLGYMAVWALWTAMLRPLTGEPIAEALERAGNYGVPLALLLLTGIPRTWESAFRARSQDTPLENEVAVMRTLTATTALLLLGHGMLTARGNLIIASHLQFAGFSLHSQLLTGYVEIAVAVLVALRPSVTLLVMVAAWKLATEALFPLTGAPIWEFVERSGSYAAPLALAALMARRTAPIRLLTPWRI